MKSSFILIIALVSILTIGCVGSESLDTPAPSSPEKATLLAPAKDMICLTGANPTATQSTVTFTWQEAANTNSYEINITNLLTRQVTTLISNTTSLQAPLDINTPYSWYITSKSNNVTATAKSEAWKFYNSGPGITSHVPYPAEIQSPARNQAISVNTNTVSLQWIGSDVDNDIASYDVYFGNTPSVALLKSGVTQQILINVNVTGGKTYYWMIATKDTQGNTSASELFSFSVK